MEKYTFSAFCIMLHQAGTLKVSTTKSIILQGTQVVDSPIADDIHPYKKVFQIGVLSPGNATLSLSTTDRYIKRKEKGDKDNILDGLEIMITPEGSSISYMVGGVNKDGNIILETTGFTVTQQTEISDEHYGKLRKIITDGAG